MRHFLCVSLFIPPFAANFAQVGWDGMGMTASAPNHLSGNSWAALGFLPIFPPICHFCRQTHRHLQFCAPYVCKIFGISWAAVRKQFHAIYSGNAAVIVRFSASYSNPAYNMLILCPV
jgi:hypothetical protein